MLASEFISNFGKEHDHRARLRRIRIAWNYLCLLALNNVLREIYSGINPPAPAIPTRAIQLRQLEIEGLPIAS